MVYISHVDLLNLHLFVVQTQCKKNRFGAPASPTQNIVVLRTGLMGAGVAQIRCPPDLAQMGATCMFY